LLFVAINGGWTLWSDWSGCSVTAGTGSQIRMRTCTNPVPENGGHLCSGDTQQKISCTGMYLYICILKNNNLFKNMIIIKQRTLRQFQLPTYNASFILTVLRLLVNHWSEWGAWAAGSGGDGSLMTRVRTCLSGSDCVGAAEETSPCTIAACAKGNYRHIIGILSDKRHSCSVIRSL